ncbi:hypothetical protein [Leptospira santarosai]|uniref:hypothetical protein n=1 Tax=Leptospira santarosai TaxID=28183 RepID=UPI0002981186|nr:hypothetical protein [Leptospira santarosai]EKR89719.1 hypothetical protein LEP1GSC163_0153 [Leptospira santarosai str. CBC379]MDI7166629.1 hypothetical protein [Leptospira santarosai]
MSDLNKVEGRPFLKSAQIQEVEKAGKMLNVLLKISSETRDRQGEMILKCAWDHPEDKAYFKSKSYIDWNHLSHVLTFSKSDSAIHRAEIEKARQGAVLGRPVDDYFWDKDALYCQARINTENEFIKPYIPLLEDGFSGLEASAAGGFFKPTQETISKYGPDTYDRARISHIAICPPGGAINPDTQMILMKSAYAQTFIRELAGNNSSGEIIIEKTETLPPLPENVNEAIAEYILQSWGYRDYVSDMLIKRMEVGLLRPDYEEIRDLLMRYGISQKEANGQAVKLLVHLDQKN